jgi:hypothetical protein
MDEKARKARNEYLKKWRKANQDKVKEYNVLGEGALFRRLAVGVFADHVVPVVHYQPSVATVADGGVRHCPIFFIH